jgi:hypothetical protein
MLWRLLRCLVLGVVLALAVGGCATPAARIKRNPDLFAGFPPEIQAAVREGQIALGYTREMVYIALGKPAREYDREDTDGVAEVWAYTDRNIIHDPYWRLYGDVWYRHRAGHYGIGLPFYGYYEREYESLRVEFRGGQVTAIERINER